MTTSSGRFADVGLAAVRVGEPVNPMVRAVAWVHRRMAMTLARSRRVAIAVAALVVALGIPGAAAEGSSTGVHLIDLGTLGSGNFSVAYAMSDRGDIVGISNAAPGSGDMHVVLWRDGRIIDLGAGVGDLGTAPFAVNNRGQVVGCISRGTPAQSGAFLWEDGQLILLGDGCAVAINDSGQVVGTRPTPTGGSLAFLWQQGTMTDLPTPDGVYSAASDINDQGQIIGGLSSPFPGQPRRAVIWDHGTMTELGTLGGPNSSCNRINNRGQVIGTSEIIFEPTVVHPFLWERGSLTDLLHLPENGSASDLNESGEVVGQIEGRPVMWRDGTLVDLGIPGYGYARDINEHGQVAGVNTGLYSSPDRAFLWSRGQTTYLDGLDGLYSHAVGIDSQGRVAGFSATPTGDIHAVVWTTTS